MRVFARVACTLAALILLVPAAALAGMPPMAKPKKKKVAAQAAQKLCAQCQYQKLVAEGKRVPPPQPLPAGAPVKGEVCTHCGAPTAVVMDGQMYRASMMAANDAPGRAVADGQPDAYVMTGEPLPIGVVSPVLAGGVPAMGMPMGGPMAGPVGMPGAGPRDASVMPTSMASDPISARGSNGPHILSHLFGLSELGRSRSEHRERAKEEQHAMIPYGTTANPVTEVPANVVYGRR